MKILPSDVREHTEGSIKIAAGAEVATRDMPHRAKHAAKACSI